MLCFCASATFTAKWRICATRGEGVLRLSTTRILKCAASFAAGVLFCAERFAPQAIFILGIFRRRKRQTFLGKTLEIIFVFGVGVDF